MTTKKSMYSPNKCSAVQQIQTHLLPASSFFDSPKPFPPSKASREGFAPMVFPIPDRRNALAGLLPGFDP